MNQKIKDHIIAYCESKGYGTTDDDIIDVLQESKEVYSEIGSPHRWYDDMFIVVNINGMLNGYDWYHITGDNSPSDMGLDFDLDSVCEVEEKQKMVTYYIPKPLLKSLTV